MNKIKAPGDNRSMRRLAEFPAADVIAAINIRAKNQTTVKFTQKIEQNLIWNTTRMRVIAASPECYICGVKVTIAAIEQDYCAVTANWRVQFYGYSQYYDQDLCMTVDHIVPASIGGPESVWNLHTCCSACNNIRGNRWEGNFRPNPLFLEEYRLFLKGLDSSSADTMNSMLDYISEKDAKILLKSIEQGRAKEKILTDMVNALCNQNSGTTTVDNDGNQFIENPDAPIGASIREILLSKGTK